jgi:hypothetical protein
MPSSLNRWFGIAGLLAVLAVAVVLRIPGFDRPPQLGFGSLYQDELKMFTNTVRVMDGKPLLPHWPYGIYRIMEPQLQLLRLVYSRMCGRSLTDPLSPANFFRVGTSRLGEVFLVIRAHALFFGLGIVVLTFVLGRRISGDAGGLAAAAVVAITPLMVSYSRMMYYDIAMVFFLLLYVIAFATALRDRSIRAVYAAVALSAVAFTMKQNAVVLFVADAWLVGSVVLAWRIREAFSTRHVWLMGLMVLVIVWIGYPTLFTWEGLKGFTDSVSTKYYGGGGSERGTAQHLWWAWIGTYWVDQAPPILLLFLVIGMVLGVRAANDRHTAGCVLAVVALYYLIGGYSTHGIDRTMMPLVPLLALGMAGWVAVLARWPSAPLRAAATAAILVFAAVPLLQNTLRYDILLTLADTRVALLQWLEEEAQNGAHVARETYAPHLPTAPEVDCAGLAAEGGKRFEVTSRNSLASEPPDWYREQGIDYLIYVPANYDRLLRQRDEGFTESPDDTSARRMGKVPRYGVPIAEAIDRYDRLAELYPVAARFTVTEPPAWMMRRCALYQDTPDPDASLGVDRRCRQPRFDGPGTIAEFLMTGWLDPAIPALWRQRDRLMLGRDAILYATHAGS